jgi:hypothetical protein
MKAGRLSFGKHEFVSVPNHMVDQKVADIVVSSEDKVAVLWESGYFTLDSSCSQVRPKLDPSAASWHLIHRRLNGQFMIGGLQSISKNFRTILCLTTDSGDLLSKVSMPLENNETSFALSTIHELGSFHSSSILAVMSLSHSMHLLRLKDDLLTIVGENLPLYAATFLSSTPTCKLKGLQGGRDFASIAIGCYESAILFVRIDLSLK